MMRTRAFSMATSCWGRRGRLWWAPRTHTGGKIDTVKTHPTALGGQTTPPEVTTRQFEATPSNALNLLGRAAAALALCLFAAHVGGVLPTWGQRSGTSALDTQASAPAEPPGAPAPAAPGAPGAAPGAEPRTFGLLAGPTPRTTPDGRPARSLAAASLCRPDMGPLAPLRPRVLAQVAGARQDLDVQSRLYATARAIDYHRAENRLPRVDAPIEGNTVSIRNVYREPAAGAWGHSAFDQTGGRRVAPVSAKASSNPISSPHHQWRL